MKYAYRSIAEFVKYVTNEHAVKEDATFPELQEGGQSSGASGQTSHRSGSNTPNDRDRNGLKSLQVSISDRISSSLSGKSAADLFEKNKDDTKENVQENGDANKIDTEPERPEQRAEGEGYVRMIPL